MGSLDAGRPHVAFLPFPFSSHCSLLFSLARLTAAAAPGAAVSFFGTARSNAQLAGLPTPPNLKIYVVADGCPAGHVPRSTVPVEEVGMFMKATPGNYVDAMQVAVGEGAGGARVSCLVSDCFLWFAGKMAEEMGVPWVAAWASAAASISAHVHMDDIARFTADVAGDQVLSTHGEKSLGFIKGLSDLRIRDLPEGIVFGDLDSPFSRLIHQMSREVPRRATTLLVNTFEEMEPAILNDLRSLFKNVLPMSAVKLLHAAESSGCRPKQADPFQCMAWLDKQAPASVVYVAFGTMLSLPPAECATLADALEASGRPFLWSMKVDAESTPLKGFLGRTAGRGLVVPWTPQTAVLGHDAVGVFLTHYGWNSVLESVAAGVPMIGRPLMFDHRLDGREVSHMWKMGLVCEADGSAMTKDWVMDAIRRVLDTDEGRMMRENATNLKNQVSNALCPGGSAIESFNSFVEIVCRDTI